MPEETTQSNGGSAQKSAMPEEEQWIWLNIC
jgi:hypothetical protein